MIACVKVDRTREGFRSEYSQILTHARTLRNPLAVKLPRVGVKNFCQALL